MGLSVRDHINELPDKWAVFYELRAFYAKNRSEIASNIRNPLIFQRKMATSEGMLCIPLNTLAAWPPGNLPASGPLPRSYFLMFGGTHEQKFASTLANFVHLSLSSYNAVMSKRYFPPSICSPYPL